MAEVLLQIDQPLIEEGGGGFDVRICGRVAEDGLWEGWIEFVSLRGGLTLRTPTETRQPNRTDLEYWATGLTVAYLEGALDRARNPDPFPAEEKPAATLPTYDRPAPATADSPPPSDVHALHPETVLDPFEVYSQGEEVLRHQLSALDEGHLRNIIRAHALVDEDDLDLLALHRPALAELIVAAIRRRSG
jgi:hypothetical protein